MADVEPAAYDEQVASLYDRAFRDIRVRRVEWRWLTSQLTALPVPRPRVLELGCGTGAVLRALAPCVASAVGVDISASMLERASTRAHGIDNLSFLRIPDSSLPFAEGSFDVVISFLSFRYLDWPRSFAEVRRVLADGGRFLLLDLVAAPMRPGEALTLARSTLRHVTARLRAPRFQRDLSALTSHPAWREMLRRHPMRPLDEYRQFFARQTARARFETLDMTPSRRVVALSLQP